MNLMNMITTSHDSREKKSQLNEKALLKKNFEYSIYQTIEYNKAVQDKTHFDMQLEMLKMSFR